MVVLDVLLETRSATTASQRLGISRSAVSHALRRLRELLEDPLLLRGERGVALSPFASQIQEQLRRTLDQLESLVELRKAKFHPAKEKGSFTIAAGEWFARYSIPELTDELERQAPGLQLHLVPIDPPTLAQRMARGELDLAFGALDPREPELESVLLAHDRMVGVVHRRHPFTKTAPTVKQYAAATHAVAAASPQLTREVVAELEQWNARVTLTLPYPVMVPHLVRDRDMVVTMPRVLALRLLEDAHELALIDPPFAGPRRGIRMVWHREAGQAPGKRWLRQRIMSLLAILGAKWSLEWTMAAE